MSGTTPGLNWAPPSPRVIEVMPGKVNKNKNRNRSIRGPEIRQLAADHIKEKTGIELDPDRVKFPRWTKFHKTIPYHWYIQGHEETKAKLEKIMYDISPNNWKVEEYEIVKRALINGSLCVVPRNDGILDLSALPPPVMEPIEIELNTEEDLESPDATNSSELVGTTPKKSKKRGAGNTQKDVVITASPNSAARRKRARVVKQDGLPSATFVEVVQDEANGSPEIIQALNAADFSQKSGDSILTVSSPFFDLMSRVRSSLGILDNGTKDNTITDEQQALLAMGPPPVVEKPTPTPTKPKNPTIASLKKSFEETKAADRKTIDDLTGQLDVSKSQHDAKDEIITLLHKRIGDQGAEISKLNFRIRELESQIKPRKR